MKIALGSDHRGDHAAVGLADFLKQNGYSVQALSPHDGQSRDYPDEAYLVGKAVASGQADMGVLICGSGNGVCIAANKVPGVRAALAFSTEAAQMSRKHNDANVLCLSGDGLEQDQVNQIVLAWLATEFEGGRHARRVRKIQAIEQGEDPATITSENQVTA